MGDCCPEEDFGSFFAGECKLGFLLRVWDSLIYKYYSVLYNTSKDALYQNARDF